MSKNNKGNVFAIAIMFFLFAMIAFVTGLQNPFGIVVKEQFGASNAMSQLGNAANFIAYAFLGLPAGFILKRRGYKVTSLLAVAVGFIGVGITFLSGLVGEFWVYLVGAFVSGFSMCMLNTVVNPMLNTLGGGGNRGNQLIQLGGSLNSLAATICPVFVGYLIGNAAQAKISDANPALFIAMGIFALAFVIILFSNIPEPELEAARMNMEKKEEEEKTSSLIKGALSHKNLVFGLIAIFLYVGIEVGVPNTMNLYLTTKTKVALEKENQHLTDSITLNTKAIDSLKNVQIAQTKAFVANNDSTQLASINALVDGLNVSETVVANLTAEIDGCKETIADNSEKIADENYVPGLDWDKDKAGSVVAIYWLLMLVGRLVGGAIGGKISSRTMITIVSSVAIILITVGILLPGTLVKFPALDSKTFSFALVDLPLGLILFVLCGLCTSVMWGAIFNLAVEGLGKYTSIASGLFMVMVCGGGILPLVQGAVADAAGFMSSYWVLVAALAFILWFGIFGSKVKK